MQPAASHPILRHPSRSGLAALAAALLAIPASAEAHVRWFIDSDVVHPPLHFPRDLTSGLVIVGAVLFAAVAVSIQQADWTARLRARCGDLYQLPAGSEWRLVGFLTGLMLIANSTMRVFLAPGLDLPDTALATAAHVAQFLLGLLLLSQFTFSIAGLLTIAISLLSACFIPLAALLNYAFEFIGLGLALFFIGPTISPVDRRVFRALGLAPDRFAHLALPVIRVAVGITLAILAVDEKLLHPDLTVLFLQHHHFNFMPMLGFHGFSDLHFALAAGVAELTFGLLLIAGLATRFVTAVLSTFFIATMLTLGPIELVGHAPLFGIAFLLISRGAGGYRLMQAAGEAAGPEQPVGLSPRPE